ncbi:MAG: c-type cytochrome [Pirellulales bacterium]|nr:c-type cytochrome [Pirellulales bacterium]
MSRNIKRLAVAVCAVVATGCVWVVSSTAYFPWTEIDAHAGEKLFGARCASCHAIDPQAGASFGPNLANIGLEAAERVADLSAEKYLLQSITHPDAFRNAGTPGVMPADIAVDLSPVQILSLIGYLKTLGSTPDASQLVALLPLAVSPQTTETTPLDFLKAQHGKEVFFGVGQCSACHQLRDLPGNTLAAPNLLHAGVHSQQYLRQSILRPNQELTPGYRQWQVVFTSGKAAVGRLVSQTDSAIELLSSSSHNVALQIISRSDIDCEEAPGITPLSQSAMPTNYGQILSTEEIDALVYFLKTLPR